MMEIPETRYVVVDGRKMAYDEVCPPDPKGTVLLLTGLAAKRIGWARQRGVFGQVYRTIALDHRDIGDSDPFTTPYTIADQADDAAVVLRALGISRAHVAGISMGGFVALELALRHPDRVDKLVLTSTSAGGTTHVRPWPRDVVRMTWPGLVYREPGRRARAVYARIMAPGYCRRHPGDWQEIAEVARYRLQSSASYRRQWQACQRHDVAARLGEIHAPTLVIHGTLDPLVRVENGRYLAERIPGARLILYPGVGHIPIVERADDYNRDVLAFLAE